MRKMKRLLSVAAALALTVSMTACGAKKDPASNNATSTPPVSNSDNGSNNGDADTAPSAEDLKPVTLKILLCGNNVTDDKAVMEKVNAYLKEKINVTLVPIWGTWGDFNDKATMSINGGDDIDLYFTSSWTADQYGQYAKKGAWVRLDDPANHYLEKYMPDIWGALPQVLKEVAVVPGDQGTGVYALPNYKDLATQNCWDVNVPLLTKYGYTLEDVKNAGFYGLGEIFETVKQGEGDNFYPFLIEGGVLERMATNSIIVAGDGGTENFFSYYLNPSDLSTPSSYGNTILSKYETPEYKQFVEKMREYFLAGYVDPVMGNKNQANEIRTSKQLTGEYLIGTQVYALGYETDASATRGFEVAMIPLTDPYCDTTSAQGGMVAISTGSQNKERAAMFLNLLNTDEYLMTTFAYGIEDVHFEKLSDGTVKFLDKRSDYQPWKNGLGNATLIPPLEGQPADFNEQFKAYYNTSIQIPIIGWAFDTTDYASEMSALVNVVAEYAGALSAGVVDPATELPKFIDKLKANGIDKVVGAANQQLSEFLAAK